MMKENKLSVKANRKILSYLQVLQLKIFCKMYLLLPLLISVLCLLPTNSL